MVTGKELPKARLVVFLQKPMLITSSWTERGQTQIGKYFGTRLDSPDGSLAVPILSMEHQF